MDQFELAELRKKNCIDNFHCNRNQTTDLLLPLQIRKKGLSGLFDQKRNDQIVFKINPLHEFYEKQTLFYDDKQMIKDKKTTKPNSSVLYQSNEHDGYNSKTTSSMSTTIMRTKNVNGKIQESRNENRKRRYKKKKMTKRAYKKQQKNFKSPRTRSSHKTIQSATWKFGKESCILTKFFERIHKSYRRKPIFSKVIECTTQFCRKRNANTDYCNYYIFRTKNQSNNAGTASKTSAEKKADNNGEKNYKLKLHVFEEANDTKSQDIRLTSTPIFSKYQNKNLSSLKDCRKRLNEFYLLENKNGSPNKPVDIKRSGIALNDTDRHERKSCERKPSENKSRNTFSFTGLPKISVHNVMHTSQVSNNDLKIIDQNNRVNTDSFVIKNKTIFETDELVTSLESTQRKSNNSLGTINTSGNESERENVTAKEDRNTDVISIKTLPTSLSVPFDMVDDKLENSRLPSPTTVQTAKTSVSDMTLNAFSPAKKYELHALLDDTAQSLVESNDSQVSQNFPINQMQKTLVEDQSKLEIHGSEIASDHQLKNCNDFKQINLTDCKSNSRPDMTKSKSNSFASDSDRNASDTRTKCKKSIDKEKKTSKPKNPMTSSKISGTNTEKSYHLATSKSDTETTRSLGTMNSNRTKTSIRSYLSQIKEFFKSKTRADTIDVKIKCDIKTEVFSCIRRNKISQRRKNQARHYTSKKFGRKKYSAQRSQTKCDARKKRSTLKTIHKHSTQCIRVSDTIKHEDLFGLEIVTESVHSKVLKFLRDYHDQLSTECATDDDIVELSDKYDKKSENLNKPVENNIISMVNIDRFDKLTQALILSRSLEPPKIPVPSLRQPSKPLIIYDQVELLELPPPPPDIDPSSSIGTVLPLFCCQNGNSDGPEQFEFSPLKIRSLSSSRKSPDRKKDNKIKTQAERLDQVKIFENVVYNCLDQINDAKFGIEMISTNKIDVLKNFQTSNQTEIVYSQDADDDHGAKRTTRKNKFFMESVSADQATEKKYLGLTPVEHISELSYVEQYCSIKSDLLYEDSIGSNKSFTNEINKKLKNYKTTKSTEINNDLCQKGSQINLQANTNVTCPISKSKVKTCREILKEITKLSKSTD